MGSTAVLRVTALETEAGSAWSAGSGSDGPVFATCCRGWPWKRSASGVLSMVSVCMMRMGAFVVGDVHGVSPNLHRVFNLFNQAQAVEDG